MWRKGVYPFAPGEGSVGYLCVESHIALVLIGEGKAWYKGELLDGKEALSRAGLAPTVLQCKEGLCLTKGCQGSGCSCSQEYFSSLHNRLHSHLCKPGRPCEYGLFCFKKSHVRGRKGGAYPGH